MIDTNTPNQLDSMLSRAYAQREFKVFARLAKKKLSRLKTIRSENDKTRSTKIFAILKGLPEWRKQQQRREKPE